MQNTLLEKQYDYAAVQYWSAWINSNKKKRSYVDDPKFTLCISPNVMTSSKLQLEMLLNYIQYILDIRTICSTNERPLEPQDMAQVKNLTEEYVNEKKLTQGYLDYIEKSCEDEDKSEKFCHTFHENQAECETVYVAHYKGFKFGQHLPSQTSIGRAKKSKKASLYDTAGSYCMLTHPDHPNVHCKPDTGSKIEYLSKLPGNIPTSKIAPYTAGHFSAFDDFLFGEYASISGLFISVERSFTYEDLEILRTTDPDDTVFKDAFSKIILKLSVRVDFDQNAKIVPLSKKKEEEYIAPLKKNKDLLECRMARFTPEYKSNYTFAYKEIFNRLETPMFAKMIKNPIYNEQLKENYIQLPNFRIDNIDPVDSKEMIKERNPMQHFGWYLEKPSVQCVNNDFDFVDAMTRELHKEGCNEEYGQVYEKDHGTTYKGIRKILSILARRFPQLKSSIYATSRTLTLNEVNNPVQFNELLNDNMIYFKDKCYKTNEDAPNLLLSGCGVKIQNTFGWYWNKALASASTLEDAVQYTQELIKSDISQLKHNLNIKANTISVSTNDLFNRGYVTKESCLLTSEDDLADMKKQVEKEIYDEKCDDLDNNLKHLQNLLHGLTIAFPNGFKECDLDIVDLDISDRLTPVEEVAPVTKTVPTEPHVEQLAPIVADVEEVKELTVRDEVEALYPGVFVDSDFENFQGVSGSPEHKAWRFRGSILMKVFEEIELTKSDKPTNESKLIELKEQNAQAIDSLHPQVQKPLHTIDSNKFPWLVKENVTNLNPELLEVS